MFARVSNIETFRRWRQDEDQGVEDLIARLTTFEPNEAMLAGTAFHKALELAQPGSYDRLTANGYTFILPDAELALPEIRELRASAEYGPLTVTGKFDAMHGKRIEDHKTTAQFKPDGYFEGCQWRFYLDIFGADVFRWNVFVIRPVADKTYEVDTPQILEQCRYPGLHDDCERLAADFYDFAARYMPDYQPALEAA
ncbi:MAG TPA: hypothetical protein VFW88_06900 [Burkholderiales bacterium]|nr:hypothetical protein [Burkholderiales bacterium]